MVEGPDIYIGLQSENVGVTHELSLKRISFAIV